LGATKAGAGLYGPFSGVVAYARLTGRVYTSTEISQMFVAGAQ